MKELAHRPLHKNSDREDFRNRPIQLLRVLLYKLFTKIMRACLSRTLDEAQSAILRERLGSMDCIQTVSRIIEL